VRRLRERNRKECDNFKEIIEQSKNLGREAGPAEHPSWPPNPNRLLSKLHGHTLTL